MAGPVAAMDGKVLLRHGCRAEATGRGLFMDEQSPTSLLGE